MSEDAGIPDLTDRYPQLEQVLADRPKRGRIPVLKQLASTDCGAACLAMVLSYFGRPTRTQEVSSVMQIGRDGATALTLVNTARWYGLRGRGVTLDVTDLEHVPTGSILHWGFSHFVVFERWRGKSGIDIVDPGSGRRRVRVEELGRQFTGVVLLLEPSGQLERGDSLDHPVRALLWTTLRQSGAWVRILGSSVLLQIFSLALPLVTGAIVDRVIPRSDAHLLFIIVVGLVGVVGFYFLASMIRAHLLLHLRIYFDSRMTLSFLEHLIDLPLAFFQLRATGDLVMRLNSNSTIREILTSGFVSGALDGTLATVYLAILFAANWSMGLLVLLLGVSQVAVVWFSRRRQRELLTENLHTQALSESALIEIIAGIETLKSMGTELDATARWAGLFAAQLNLSVRRGRLAALTESLSTALRVASPLVLLAFGALGVIHGRMSLGSTLALLALAQGVLTPLSSIVSVAGQFQLLGSYIERLDDVLRAPREQTPGTWPRAPELRGGIRLDGVSFQYHPSAAEVVRNVSVTIEPGQFVAVVGCSGSGKSTLASLLLGLYRPTRGQILFDGINIADVEVRSLRRQLGTVNQRPFLFAGSIRANIAASDPTLTLEHIVEAARRASIHDDIARLPLGYETPLSEGGGSLSGGQRQRVALARALARRPAILLLDEATSALDSLSERAVQRELERMGCTRIVIAHRLSTIREADVILVMRDGELVEQGTHEQLVASCGHYAELVAGQVLGDGAALPPTQRQRPALVPVEPNR